MSIAPYGDLKRVRIVGSLVYIGLQLVNDLELEFHSFILNAGRDI
jgi:hypothetical protein